MLIYRKNIQGFREVDAISYEFRVPKFKILGWKKDIVTEVNLVQSGATFRFDWFGLEFETEHEPSDLVSVSKRRRCYL